VIWPKLFSVVKSSGPGGMIFALAALIVVVLLSPLFIVCHPSFTPACLLGQLKEFQTLIAGVVGFGGLVAAAIYNGQQDRAKEGRAEDRHVRNLAHALALECRELGIECGSLGLSVEEILAALEKQAAPGSQQVALFHARFREVVQPQDTLLERLSPAELSRLGFNAYGFARLTRLALRRARFRAKDAPTGKASRGATKEWLTQMSDKYFHCAVNCRKLSELLQIVANQGAVAANRVEPPKSARDEEIAAERKSYIER